MASRFEQITDIDKLLALRSAGLLYWQDAISDKKRLLYRREMERSVQEMLCRQGYPFYVLVEDDADE